MKHVYLADPQSGGRLAFRLILQYLKMQVVGEAADRPTALARAPATRPDMLMVDWGLVAAGADVFIDKGEISYRVVDRLRDAVASIRH